MPLLLLSVSCGLGAALQVSPLTRRGSGAPARAGAPTRMLTAMDVPGMLGALANVAPAYASDDAIIAAAQRVSDTEGLAALGLGNAAVEGDIGMRPTLGGVNLFVFYAIYQVAFQVYLRSKNGPAGGNVGLIDGKKYVNGKLAEDASASRRRKEKNEAPQTQPRPQPQPQP